MSYRAKLVGEKLSELTRTSHYTGARRRAAAPLGVSLWTEAARGMVQKRYESKYGEDHGYDGSTEALVFDES